jgi:D-alanyl-D-alanine dipeptidase
MKIKSSLFFKVVAITLCFLMVTEQSGYAQVAGQIDLAGRFSALRSSFSQDRFRPLHLRYLQYEPQTSNFKMLVDKGNLKSLSNSFAEQSTKTLLQYFLIGVALPNDSFWVNLRPDSPDNVIDPFLAQTDVGKILLEADVQLKKDTALATSPETREGKEYWDKLYKRAGEIFGSQNVTIPTLTRPWIVPGEIIVRESSDNAYVYKATLKVMLEEDYLKSTENRGQRTDYTFDDPRLKELNVYATEILREKIIPKLTLEVNTSKRYAALRQVYYSLILAQWFKQGFKAQPVGKDIPLPDSRDLTGLASKQAWSKDTYFQQYQKSFKEGEYNFKTPVSTPYGQVIRSYFSGGIDIDIAKARPARVSASSPLPAAVAGSPNLLGVSGTTGSLAVSSAPAAPAPSQVEGPAAANRDRGNRPTASSSSGSRFHKVNGRVVGAFDPASGQIYFDFAGARQAIAGISHEQAVNFLYMHEAYHQLLRELGLLEELNLSEEQEEDLVNGLAKEKTGISLSASEQAAVDSFRANSRVQDLIAQRAAQPLFDSSSQAAMGDFMLDVHRAAPGAALDNVQGVDFYQNDRPTELLRELQEKNQSRKPEEQVRFADGNSWRDRVAQWVKGLGRKENAGYASQGAGRSSTLKERLVRDGEVPVGEIVALQTRLNQQLAMEDKAGQGLLGSLKMLIDYWSHNIANFISRQFADQERGVVELVSNGLDASDGSVQVSLRPGELIVANGGPGINLNSIFTCLLIPTYSTKSLQDEKIGRFGVGFLSSLNYLNSEDDVMEIVSFNNGVGFRIRLSARTEGQGRQKRKIVVIRSIEEDISLSRQEQKRLFPGISSGAGLSGTSIRVQSQDLNEQEVAAVREAIIKRFSYWSGACVVLRTEGPDGQTSVQEIGLDKASYREVYAQKGGKSGKRFRVLAKVSQTNPSDLSIPQEAGSGQLVITHQGVQLYTIPILGSNAAESLVVNLPASTKIPTSRDKVIPGKDTVDGLMEAAKAISADSSLSLGQRIALLNSLYYFLDWVATAGPSLVTGRSEEFQNIVQGLIQVEQARLISATGTVLFVPDTLQAKEFFEGTPDVILVNPKLIKRIEIAGRQPRRLDSQVAALKAGGLEIFIMPTVGARPVLRLGRAVFVKDAPGADTEDAVWQHLLVAAAVDLWVFMMVELGLIEDSRYESTKHFETDIDQDAARKAAVLNYLRLRIEKLREEISGIREKIRLAENLHQSIGQELQGKLKEAEQALETFAQLLAIVERAKKGSGFFFVFKKQIAAGGLDFSFINRYLKNAHNKFSRLLYDRLDMVDLGRIMRFTESSFIKMDDSVPVEQAQREERKSGPDGLLEARLVLMMLQASGRGKARPVDLQEDLDNEEKNLIFAVDIISQWMDEGEDAHRQRIESLLGDPANESEAQELFRIISSYRMHYAQKKAIGQRQVTSLLHFLNHRFMHQAGIVGQAEESRIEEVNSAGPAGKRILRGRLADIVASFFRLGRNLRSVEEVQPEEEGLRFRAAQGQIQQSVNYQDPEEYVFIRELLQNCRDAILELEKLKGRLSAGRRRIDVNVRLVRDNGRIKSEVVVSDPVGMDISSVLNFLVIPNRSSKVEEFLTGFFGHGFFTTLRESEEVRVRTSTGDGRIITLVLTPRLDEQEGVITDVNYEIYEEKGSLRGTEIVWRKRGDANAIDSGLLRAKAEMFIRTMSADIPVYLNGSQVDIIDRNRAVVSEFTTASGARCAVYLDPGRPSLVLQRGLFVTHFDRHFLEDVLGVPLTSELATLLLRLADAGVLVELPEELGLTRDRAHFIKRDFTPEMRDIVMAALVDAAVKAVLAGRVRLPYNFSYDFLTEIRAEGLSGSRYLENVAYNYGGGVDFKPLLERLEKELLNAFKHWYISGRISLQDILQGIRARVAIYNEAVRNAVSGLLSSAEMQAFIEAATLGKLTEEHKRNLSARIQASLFGFGSEEGVRWIINTFNERFDLLRNAGAVDSTQIMQFLNSILNHGAFVIYRSLIERSVADSIEGKIGGARRVTEGDSVIYKLFKPVYKLTVGEKPNSTPKEVPLASSRITPDIEPAIISHLAEQFLSHSKLSLSDLFQALGLAVDELNDARASGKDEHLNLEKTLKEQDIRTKVGLSEISLAKVKQHKDELPHLYLFLKATRMMIDAFRQSRKAIGQDAESGGVVEALAYYDPQDTRVLARGGAGGISWQLGACQHLMRALMQYLRQPSDANFEAFLGMMIETVSHELTHVDEVPLRLRREGTHNKEFFDRQLALLGAAMQSTIFQQSFRQQLQALASEYAALSPEARREVDAFNGEKAPAAVIDRIGRVLGKSQGTDSGYEGGAILESTARAAYEAAKGSPVPASRTEHLKEMLTRSFGRMPNLLLLSRAKMDELGIPSTNRIIRYGNNIIIEEEYYKGSLANKVTEEETLSAAGRGEILMDPLLNVLVHEATASYLEEEFIDADTLPMDAEGKLDQDDWNSRRERHEGIVADRSMDGAGSSQSSAPVQPDISPREINISEADIEMFKRTPIILEELGYVAHRPAREQARRLFRDRFGWRHIPLEQATDYGFKIDEANNPQGVRLIRPLLETLQKADIALRKLGYSLYIKSGLRTLRQQEDLPDDYIRKQITEKAGVLPDLERVVARARAIDRVVREEAVSEYQARGSGIHKISEENIDKKNRIFRARVALSKFKEVGDVEMAREQQEEIKRLNSFLAQNKELVRGIFAAKVNQDKVLRRLDDAAKKQIAIILADANTLFADPEETAAHLSGAAVDFEIWKDGKFSRTKIVTTEKQWFQGMLDSESLDPDEAGLRMDLATSTNFDNLENYFAAHPYRGPPQESASRKLLYEILCNRRVEFQLMLKMKMTPLRGEWWHANFHNLAAGATHGVEVYFPARPEALADSASPLLNRRSGFSRLFAMLALAGFTALSASAGILLKNAPVPAPLTVTVSPDSLPNALDSLPAAGLVSTDRISSPQVISNSFEALNNSLPKGYSFMPDYAGKAKSILLFYDPAYHDLFVSLLEKLPEGIDVVFAVSNAKGKQGVEGLTRKAGNQHKFTILNVADWGESMPLSIWARDVGVFAYNPNTGEAAAVNPYNSAEQYRHYFRGDPAALQMLVGTRDGMRLVESPIFFQGGNFLVDLDEAGNTVIFMEGNILVNADIAKSVQESSPVQNGRTEVVLLPAKDDVSHVDTSLTVLRDASGNKVALVGSFEETMQAAENNPEELKRIVEDILNVYLSKPSNIRKSMQPDQARLDKIAKIMESRGYRVLRVPWINKGSALVSYNNVLFLDAKTIMMPVYGLPTDDQAQKVYESLGLKVLTVPAAKLIHKRGALRCFTNVIRKAPSLGAAEDSPGVSRVTEQSGIDRGLKSGAKQAPANAGFSAPEALPAVGGIALGAVLGPVIAAAFGLTIAPLFAALIGAVVGLAIGLPAAFLLARFIQREGGSRYAVVSPLDWAAQEMRKMEEDYARAASGLLGNIERDSLSKQRKLGSKYKALQSRVRSMLRSVTKDSPAYRALESYSSHLEKIHQEALAILTVAATLRDAGSGQDSKALGQAEAVLDLWQREGQDALVSPKASLARDIRELSRQKEAAQKLEAELKAAAEELNNEELTGEEKREKEEKVAVLQEKVTLLFDRMDKERAYLAIPLNRMIDDLGSRLSGLFESELYAQVFLAQDGNAEKEALLKSAVRSDFSDTDASNTILDAAVDEIALGMRERGIMDWPNTLKGLKQNASAQRIAENELGKDLYRLQRKAQAVRVISRSAAVAVPLAALCAVIYASLVLISEHLSKPAKPEANKDKPVSALQEAPKIDTNTASPTPETKTSIQEQARTTVDLNAIISDMNTNNLSGAAAGLTPEQQKEIQGLKEKINAIKLQEAQLARQEQELQKKMAMPDKVVDAQKAIAERAGKYENTLTTQERIKQDTGRKEKISDIKWSNLSLSRGALGNEGESALKQQGKPGTDSAESLASLPQDLGSRKVSQGGGAITPGEGAWLADVTGGNGYIAEPLLPKVNPLTGAYSSVKRNWRAWTVDDPKSATGQEILSFPAKEGFLLVPPGKVVVSAQAQNSGTAELYYDPVNRGWYIKCSAAPGILKLGIRDGTPEELGPLPALEIDQSVKDTWKNSLPQETRSLLESARGKTQAEKAELRDRIMKMFYYSTNPLLEELAAGEKDFIAFAFKYFTLKCDGLALLYSLISYELGLPAIMQIGYASGAESFYAGAKHAWVVTDRGIVEVTALTGGSSPLTYKKGASQEEFRKEIRILKSRANHQAGQAGLMKHMSQISEDRAALREQKNAAEKEIKKIQSINPAAEDPVDYYARLKRSYEQKKGQVSLLGPDDLNPAFLSDCLRAIDNLASSSRDQYQLMASADFLRWVLSERLYYSQSVDRNSVLAAEKKLFSTVIQVAQINGWQLREPYRTDAAWVRPPQSDSRLKYLKTYRSDDGNLFYAEDILTGEKIWLLPSVNSRIVDYSQGILVTLDIDGQYSFHGRKAGSFVGKRYAGFKGLYTTAKGEWLAFVNPDKGFLGDSVIGTLNGTAGSKEVYSGGEVLEETVRVSADGKWIAVVSHGIDTPAFSKTLVGNCIDEATKKISLDDGRPQALVLADGTIMRTDLGYGGPQPFFLADGTLMLTDANGKQIFIGPQAEKIKSLVNGRKVLSHRVLPNGDWLMIVVDNNSSSSFIGPLAEKWRLSVTFPFYASIQKIYPNGLIKVKFANGAGHTFVGPLAQSVGLEGIPFEEASDPAFSSDGRKWVAHVRMGEEGKHRKYFFVGNWEGVSSPKDILSAKPSPLGDFYPASKPIIVMDGLWMMHLDNKDDPSDYLLYGPLADKYDLSGGKRFASSHLITMSNGKIMVLYPGPARWPARLVSLGSGEEELGRRQPLEPGDELYEEVWLPEPGMPNFVITRTRDGQYRIGGEVAKRAGCNMLTNSAEAERAKLFYYSGNDVLEYDFDKSTKSIKHSVASTPAEGTGGASFHGVVVCIGNKTYSYGRIDQDFLERFVSSSHIASMHAGEAIGRERWDVRFGWIKGIADAAPGLAVRELARLYRDISEEKIATDEHRGPGSVIVELSKPMAVFFDLIRALHLVSTQDFADMFLAMRAAGMEAEALDWIKITGFNVSWEKAGEVARLMNLTEVEWGSLIDTYIAAKRKESGFQGEAYLNTFNFEGKDREVVRALNRLRSYVWSNNEQGDIEIVQQASEEEGKFSGDMEILDAVVENSKIPVGPGERLDRKALQPTLRALHAKSIPRVFDAQVLPADREHPAYELMSAIRDNPLTIKYPYGDYAPEKEGPRRLWEHYNKKLSGALGEDFAGGEGLESAWKGLLDEFTHDLWGVGLILGLLIFFSYYYSEHLRRKDIIVGPNARKVIERVWEINPWFKGEKALKARMLLDEIMQLNSQSMTPAQEARLKAMRASLNPKEKAIFDLIRCMAFEPSQESKALLNRLAYLLPYIGALFAFFDKSHTKRQALNKALLILVEDLSKGRQPGLSSAASLDYSVAFVNLANVVKAAAVSSKTVIIPRESAILDSTTRAKGQMTDVEAFYRAMEDVIADIGGDTKFGNVEDGSREVSFEEVRRQLLKELETAYRLRTEHFRPYLLKPNGWTLSLPGRGSGFYENRNYQQGDDLRDVDWKGYARTDKLQVKTKETDVTKEASIFINMESLFDEDEAPGDIESLAKSLIMMMDKRRTDGKHLYTMDEIIFLMPDGTLEFQGGIPLRRDTIPSIISALKDRFSRAKEQVGKNKPRTYALENMYSTEQGKRYTARTVGVFGGRKELGKKEIEKLTLHRLHDRIVFCVGVNNGSGRQIVRALLEGRAVPAVWDKQTARSVSRFGAPAGIQGEAARVVSGEAGEAAIGKELPDFDPDNFTRLAGRDGAFRSGNYTVLASGDVRVGGEALGVKNKVEVFEAPDAWFVEKSISGNAIVVPYQGSNIIVIRSGISAQEREDAFRHELRAIMGMEGIGLDTKGAAEHPLVHAMGEGGAYSEEFDTDRSFAQVAPVYHAELGELRAYIAAADYRNLNSVVWDSLKALRRVIEDEIVNEQVREALEDSLNNIAALRAFNNQNELTRQIDRAENALAEIEKLASAGRLLEVDRAKLPASEFDASLVLGDGTKAPKYALSRAEGYSQVARQARGFVSSNYNLLHSKGLSSCEGHSLEVARRLKEQGINSQLIYTAILPGARPDYPKGGWHVWVVTEDGFIIDADPLGEDKTPVILHRSQSGYEKYQGKPLLTVNSSWDDVLEQIQLSGGETGAAAAGGLKEDKAIIATESADKPRAGGVPSAEESDVTSEQAEREGLINYNLDTLSDITRNPDHTTFTMDFTDGSSVVVASLGQMQEELAKRLKRKPHAREQIAAADKLLVDNQDLISLITFDGQWHLYYARSGSEVFDTFQALADKVSDMRRLKENEPLFDANDSKRQEELDKMVDGNPEYRVAVEYVMADHVNTRDAQGNRKWIIYFKDKTRLTGVKFEEVEAKIREHLGLGPKAGGIDFRALPIATQAMPVSRGRLPNMAPASLPNPALDKKWSEIEAMLNSGISPSIERIKEYLSLSCGAQDCADRLDKALGGIADILRMEEERCCQTEEPLKQVLFLLESGKGAQGVRAALADISVAAKEPVIIKQ